jgi:hypothetical protein
MARRVSSGTIPIRDRREAHLRGPNYHAHADAIYATIRTHIQTHDTVCLHYPIAFLGDYHTGTARSRLAGGVVLRKGAFVLQGAVRVGCELCSPVVPLTVSWLSSRPRRRRRRCMATSDPVARSPRLTCDVAFANLLSQCASPLGASASLTAAGHKLSSSMLGLGLAGVVGTVLATSPWWRNAWDRAVTSYDVAVLEYEERVAQGLQPSTPGEGLVVEGLSAGRCGWAPRIHT